MKKIIVLAILAAMMVPTVAAALPVESCTIGHDLRDFDVACSRNAVVNDSTPAWGMCCMLDAIYTVTDWIFFILLAVVSLLVIWGGFTIATAGGAPDKVNEGRNYILYALLGLALALLSRAIPSIARALVGG